METLWNIFFVVFLIFFVQYFLPIFCKTQRIGDKRLSVRGAIRELMSVVLSYCKTWFRRTTSSCKVSRLLNCFSFYRIFERRESPITINAKQGKIFFWLCPESSICTYLSFAKCHFSELTRQASRGSSVALKTRIYSEVFCVLSTLWIWQSRKSDFLL